MIKVNGLSVSRIPINGKETLRVMKNGQQLWSGTGLPTGYTPIEYIQSSGSQYIDTGFKPNNNTRVVADTEVVSASGYPNPYGCWDNTLTNSFILLYGRNLESMQPFFGTQQAVETFDASGRHITDANKNKFYVDGNLLYTFDSAVFSSLFNLFLFAYNNKGSAGNIASTIRMYSCQIYDNDILMRDYIPCMNPEGICGLFDKVNRVFYQSATSTPFTGA